MDASDKDGLNGVIGAKNRALLEDECKYYGKIYSLFPVSTDWTKTVFEPNSKSHKLMRQRFDIITPKTLENNINGSVRVAYATLEEGQTIDIVKESGTGRSLRSPKSEYGIFAKASDGDTFKDFQKAILACSEYQQVVNKLTTEEQGQLKENLDWALREYNEKYNNGSRDKLVPGNEFHIETVMDMALERIPESSTVRAAKKALQKKRTTTTTTTTWFSKLWVPFWLAIMALLALDKSSA